MTPFQRRMNSYIRRMAEDMQLRNLAPAGTAVGIARTVVGFGARTSERLLPWFSSL